MPSRSPPTSTISQRVQPRQTFFARPSTCRCSSPWSSPCLSKACARLQSQEPFPSSHQYTLNSVSAGQSEQFLRSPVLVSSSVTFIAKVDALVSLLIDSPSKPQPPSQGGEAREGDFTGPPESPGERRKDPDTQTRTGRRRAVEGGTAWKPSRLLSRLAAAPR